MSTKEKSEKSLAVSNNNILSQGDGEWEKYQDEETGRPMGQLSNSRPSLDLDEYKKTQTGLIRDKSQEEVEYDSISAAFLFFFPTRLFYHDDELPEESFFVCKSLDGNVGLPTQSGDPLKVEKTSRILRAKLACRDCPFIKKDGNNRSPCTNRLTGIGYDFDNNKVFMTHFMGSSFMPALDFFNDSERENTGRPLFADIVELKAKKIEKGSRSFHIYEFDLVNVLDPENDKDKLERLKTMYTKGKDYVKKQQALAYSLSERILHQSNTEIDSMIQEDESDFVDGEITTEDLQEKDEEDDDEPNVSMEDLPF